MVRTELVTLLKYPSKHRYFIPSKNPSKPKPILKRSHRSSFSFSADPDAPSPSSTTADRALLLCRSRLSFLLRHPPQMEPVDLHPRSMAGSSAIRPEEVGSNVLPESFVRSLKALEMFLFSPDEENPELELMDTSTLYAIWNSMGNTDGTLGVQPNPPSFTAASKGKSIDQDTSLIELARESNGGSRNPPFRIAATNKQKRHWSHKEDMLLKELVKQYGAGNWALISARIAGRTGKQCRERWFNNLNPEIKNGPWCPEEETKLIEGHKKFRNGWSAIASLIPGRTENAVKNKWNTSKRKLERIINLTNHDDYQMGVSSNRQTKKFNLSNLDKYVRSILFDDEVLATASEPTGESLSLKATSSMEDFSFQNPDSSVFSGYQGYHIDQLMADVSTPPNESSSLYVTSTVQVFSVPDPSLYIFSEFQDHNIDHVKRQLAFNISSTTAQSSSLLITREEKCHSQDPQMPLYVDYNVENFNDELLGVNESTIWASQPILDFD